MSEISAIVIRRTTSYVSELNSGALALTPGQWGLATVDDKLVCRDIVGAYHYFPGGNAIASLIADGQYFRAPVASLSSLPPSDPVGDPGAQQPLDARAGIARRIPIRPKRSSGSTL